MESLIRQGLVHEYKQMAGKYYSVKGIISEGEKRGRLLGFPTANIISDDLPPAGIYAVIAEMKGAKHKGVANIGYAPTFGRNKLVLEVHLFDFSENLYRREMKVMFIQKIRNEKKFSGADELIHQIKADCEEARKILSGLVI